MRNSDISDRCDEVGVYAECFVNAGRTGDYHCVHGDCVRNTISDLLPDVFVPSFISTMKTHNEDTQTICRDSNRHNKPGDDGLEGALEEIGDLSPWLWWVFLLACTPNIINVWHDTVYVFIGADLPHWCNVEQLRGTNWTRDQIRTIVTGDPTTSSCTALNWNYTQLAGLSYVKAWAVTNTSLYPGSFQCQDFNYIGSGIMAEWDLVCGRAALRSTVQTAGNVGDIIGGLLFGFIGDKWGRRRAFAWSCVTFVVAGLWSPFAASYALFIVTRIGVGMAGTGTFNSAFTILTEICNPRHRSLLGNLFNMPYALAMISLSGVAFYLRDHWHVLQLAISVPTVILIAVHCVFLPESPRWLITQGRRDEAWEVVKRATRGRRTPNKVHQHQTISQEVNHNETSPILARKATLCHPWYQGFLESISTITTLFSNSELRWRLLICCSARFTTALVFYALTLNADNFKLDSYVFPVFMLKYIGRRPSSSLLYLVASVSLLSIQLIPQENSWATLCVAMAGKMCIGAVFSLIILFFSELFPTDVRTTAVGSCSAASNIGSMLAPFLVDLLGAQEWYIPSTLCGVLCLLAGLLVLLLPETRDKELSDTVQQVADNHTDRVSFKNLCIWK